ncbi:MAG: cell envelope integrity protein TolA [Gammaproteobacteria bacterium]|nr:cell envelope integrity protein TolA [Gammaproteobacteria bacterium]
MHTGFFHELKNHPVALGLSIVLHLVLLVILTISLDHTQAPKMPAAPKAKTVQAVVVDASQVDRELNKLKLAEQRKKDKELDRKKRLERDAKKARDKRRQEEKRLAELKRKQKQAEKAEKAKQVRLDKERKQKQAELDKLEKQRQQEQQRLAAIEAKRKAEEAAEQKKQAAAEAEARRQAEEAELKRRMAEEEARQKAHSSEMQKLRAQYVLSIQQKVERQWQTPLNMVAGWSCEVMVQQNRFGDVLQVQMLKCSGNEAFKSSVERAVRKASPLPEPPSNDVFDKKLQFTFRPNT